MPVSYIPSAEQLVDRQKTTAKKRRRNQNAEIDELAKLLPVKAMPLGSTNGGTALEAVPGEARKVQAVDKISVLRITSTFLKFQEFLKNGYFNFAETAAEVQATAAPSANSLSRDLMSELISEAMDGFLIAMDKDATILFASESITSYIGLTQHDVIGQNLEDITHPDDAEIIQDNLTPKVTLPPGITNKTRDTQPRQFYIRFKSTMSPGRVQLSRFNSYTMVQVTGNLKVHIPDSDSTKERDSRNSVIGFVGECRLIESTASILEISIPQSYFTTTVSMDMKIVSVESQMKELIGFSADEFIGTRLRDYFHPADYTKLIPCEVMLMHTGHAVSPVFRFMASSGGWAWMQMEGILRYKPGTKDRQFWEIKVKLVSQEEGHVALIEQNELYTLNSDPNQDMLNPHKDRNFLSRLSNTKHLCSSQEGAEPIIKSLEKANLPQSLVDGVLHSREMGLQHLPGSVKRVLHHNQADAFKVKLRKSLADGTWGKPDPVPPPKKEGGSNKHRQLMAELSSSSMESPLPRSTWGMPETFPPDPEEEQGTSPPPSLSPAPTVTSTLSSLTSDRSSSMLTQVQGNGSGVPQYAFNRATPNATPTPCPELAPGAAQSHLDNLQVNSEQHTIAYYTPGSQAAPSPASSHASPYPQPVASPSHSLFYGADTGSGPNSAVSSPAPSSGVGMYYSASPSSSLVSEASRFHGSNTSYDQRSVSSQQQQQNFSLIPPGVAMTSLFGKTSTEDFSFQAQQQHGGGQVPFQQQVNVPPAHSHADDTELCQILDHLDSMESDQSPRSLSNQDAILDQLIHDAGPSSLQDSQQQNSPYQDSHLQDSRQQAGVGSEIRYYDVDVHTSSHHVMSGDMQVMGHSSGRVGEQAGGNSDIMEILSQFS